MVHLTEKPVELAGRAFCYSSKPGEHVLGLFGGSGSTFIGCERTGQRAFLMEIDTGYGDVILKRWQEVTRSPAVFIDGGRQKTFEEVAEQRGIDLKEDQENG